VFDFNFSKSIEIPDFKFQIKSNFKAEVVNESCSSSYIKFSNLSTNGTNFKWDFGDGTNSEENSPLHYYKSKGEFEVSLLVQNQKCRETSSQKIDFVPISFPNLITNNGDGLNDFYRIDGLNQPIFLEAFNRWGEKVFSAESYQNNWKPSQPGSYFVYLRFANGESCSDWILVNN
jgi:PKD repeat protein